MADSKGVPGVIPSLEMRTLGSDSREDKPKRPYDAQDNVELTRTGKKPVLKVCSPCHLLTSFKASLADLFEAQF